MANVIYRVKPLADWPEDIISKIPNLPPDAPILKIRSPNEDGVVEEYDVDPDTREFTVVEPDGRQSRHLNADPRLVRVG